MQNLHSRQIELRAQFVDLIVYIPEIFGYKRKLTKPLPCDMEDFGPRTGMLVAYLRRGFPGRYRPVGGECAEMIQPHEIKEFDVGF